VLLQHRLQHRWSWKTLEPQQQRLLLEWTPMNEHAERQKRHKDMADKVLEEVRPAATNDRGITSKQV
jgi:hypothetical protein